MAVANATIRLVVRSESANRQLGLILRAARQRINETIGRTLVSITKSNFGFGGEANRSAPWPPYAHTYSSTKKKGGPVSLITSGALLSSIRYTATPNGLVLSASPDYAAVHQFGSGGGLFSSSFMQGSPYRVKGAKQTKKGGFGKSRPHIPPRPYFPLINTTTGYEISAGATAQIQVAVNRELSTLIK